MPAGFIKMIPKIIHQIWIGSSPIPDREKLLCKKIKSSHPDYEYMFWDNESINSLPQKHLNKIQELKTKLNKASFIADYIKLAVCHEHGGIYLDCDIELTDSLNSLDLTKNLIISTQRRHLYIQFAFFASCKNYYILNDIINSKNIYYFHHWSKFFHRRFLSEIRKNFDPPEKLNIFHVNQYYNDILVLDRRYFWDGILGKHYGLLSHKKEGYYI